MCKKFKILILVLLFGLPSLTLAKPYLIGISVWSGYPENVRGFKQALADAGIEEGRDLTYLYRNAGGERGAQQKIAEEFRDAKVDMVYSLTTPGTVAIKALLPKATPLVFSIVTYPADSGLIESFDYSGNNLVGTSNYVPLHHYVDLLKKFLPGAKSVAIFHRQGEPNSKIQTINLIRLFKRAGIVALDQAVQSIDDLVDMAGKLSSKVDAFVTTTDTLMQNGGEKALVAVSLREGVPILSSNKQGIEAGSSFGPVVDFYRLGFMSGQMAARIIQEGKVPSAMASRYQEPPTVLVNLKSTIHLGIVIPETIKDLTYVD
ncbi:hypothetical protein A9Q89_06610 [Gammaproteobacteria bacterium 53_120_T64]|nr:hypothetical protein A9Q89_06610 [Gammaproteobacteria bacterium 53_120_T64]